MIEFHRNGRFIVAHNFEDALAISVDSPITHWEHSPEARFLVVTSCMDQALLYRHLARHVHHSSTAVPLTKSQTKHELVNEKGGSIYFTSIGSALMGRQFDYILFSDPREMHRDNPKRVCEFINAPLLLKLAPN